MNPILLLALLTTSPHTDAAATVVFQPALRCGDRCDPSPYCRTTVHGVDAPVLWCRAVDVKPQGGEPGVWSLRHLAELAAPAIWFSPDEPLIRERNRRLPQPIPPEADFKIDPLFDDDDSGQPNPRPYRKPNERAAAYYRIDGLLYGTGAAAEAAQAALAACDEGGALADCPVEWAELERIRVRYFYYFEEDIGVGNHLNDLEEFEVDLRVECAWIGERGEQKSVDCGAATADPGEALGPEPHLFRRILGHHFKGKAHGATGYSNRLNPGADTNVPLYIFIEEGKHAVAPDRNGDGDFTLGYDVNARTADAWGIRDTFAGSLPGPRYDPGDFKRRGRYLACPDTSWLACPRAEPEEAAWSYELISTHDTPACTDAKKNEVEKHSRRRHRANVFKVCERMESNGFRKRPRVTSYGADFNYGAYGLGGLSRNVDLHRLSAYTHWSRGRQDVELAAYVPLDLVTGIRSGYVGVRSSFSVGDARFSLQDVQAASWLVGLVYTPSRARLLDWYVAVDYGLRREHRFWLEGGVEGRQLLAFIPIKVIRGLRLRAGLRTRLQQFGVESTQVVLGVGW